MQMQAQQQAQAAATAGQLPPGAPGAAGAGAQGALPPGLLSAAVAAGGAHPGSPNAAAVQAAAAAAAAAAAGLPNTLSLQSLLAGIPTSGAATPMGAAANLPHPAFASLLAQQKPGLFPEPPKKEDDHAAAVAAAKTNGGEGIRRLIQETSMQGGQTLDQTEPKFVAVTMDMNPLIPLGKLLHNYTITSTYFCKGTF